MIVVIIVDVDLGGGDLVCWIEPYMIIDHIERGNCECLLREVGRRAPSGLITILFFFLLTYLAQFKKLLMHDLFWI